MYEEGIQKVWIIIFPESRNLLQRKWNIKIEPKYVGIPAIYYKTGTCV